MTTMQLDNDDNEFDQRKLETSKDERGGSQGRIETNHGEAHPVRCENVPRQCRGSFSPLTFCLNSPLMQLNPTASTTLIATATTTRQLDPSVGKCTTTRAVNDKA